MKSTKKKKSPIVEDFINSLMEDLNEPDSITEKPINKKTNTSELLTPVGVVKNKNPLFGLSSELDGVAETKSQIKNIKTQTQIQGIQLEGTVAPVILTPLTELKENLAVSSPDISTEISKKLPIELELNPSKADFELVDLESKSEMEIFGPDSSIEYEKSVSLNLDLIPNLDSDDKQNSLPSGLFQMNSDNSSENSSDDATIPMGFEAHQSLEMDKTIPPDPQQNYRDPRMKAGGDFKLSDELSQAEHLRMAQQHIFQLEKENDQLRSENDELANAAEIIKNRVEDSASKMAKLEQALKEEKESYQSEIFMLKGNLQHKENENIKSKLKIEDLEARLRTDFRKIRVRERELENRLELLKAEKLALVRAKDENILELRRKIDVLQNEIESYRSKLLELNHIIDSNQDQFKRTVKALRLALSSLEIRDENVIPLKKAE